MKKTKLAYNDHDRQYSCDQSNNCAECNEFGIVFCGGLRTDQEMKKIKEVCNNYNCINRFECNQTYISVCDWFQNKYEYEPDDKTPLIAYEYKKRSLIGKLLNWVKI